MLVDGNQHMRKAWNKGIRMSVEFRKKVSAGVKNQWTEGRAIPGFKKGNIPWNLNKTYTVLALKGERNPNWRGGKQSSYQVWKKSLEYRRWRKAVFDRDNYTCQNCLKKGGKLNADHIKPYALFPEFRFSIENGRTLCIDCHQLTDTFGGRTRTYFIRANS